MENDRPERALKKAPPGWGPGGEDAGAVPCWVRGEQWEAKATLLIVSQGRGYVRFLPGITTGWVSLDRIWPRDEG